jgi:MFS family permease
MKLSLAHPSFHTFDSFHHRNYRFYFLGQFLSQAGTWLQSGAQAWLILQVTHSASAVGMVTFWQFGPYALLGLFGGAISDRFDRRKTIMVTQLGLLFCSATLAIVVLSQHVVIWQLYVIAAIRGIVLVIDTPARQAFVVQMVGRGELPNAVALNVSLFNGSRIIGPAIGGLLIGAFGVGICFVIDSISYVAVIFALLKMRPAELYPVTRNPEPTTLLRSMRDGLRYAWRTPAILLALAILLVIATVCINFTVILPVLAVQTLHAGPQVFGLVSSFFGIGALIGALVSASIARATWPVLLTSAAIFGVAMLVLAPQRSLVMALGLLVLTGIAFTLYTSNSNALVQLATPSQLQGRVVGLYGYIFNGTTVFGALLIGLLCEIGGTQLAFLVAGATALTMAILGMFAVRRFHVTSPQVVTEGKA